MIKSFACKRTEKLFKAGKAEGFLKAIEKQATRKLSMLYFTEATKDLKAAYGNRFEHLKGDRKGQCSIRVNEQYRLCFRFEDRNAYDVEIVDYH